MSPQRGREPVKFDIVDLSSIALSAKRVLLPQGSTGEVQNGYDYLCKYSRFFLSEVDHVNGEALKKYIDILHNIRKVKISTTEY